MLGLESGPRQLDPHPGAATGDGFEGERGSDLLGAAGHVVEPVAAAGGGGGIETAAVVLDGEGGVAGGGVEPQGDVCGPAVAQGVADGLAGDEDQLHDGVLGEGGGEQRIGLHIVFNRPGGVHLLEKPLQPLGEGDRRRGGRLEAGDVAAQLGDGAVEGLDTGGEAALRLAWFVVDELAGALERHAGGVDRLDHAVVQVAAEGGAGGEGSPELLLGGGAVRDLAPQGLALGGGGADEGGDAAELVAVGLQRGGEGGVASLEAGLDAAERVVDPAMDEPGGDAEKHQSEPQEEGHLRGVVGYHVGEQRAGVAQREPQQRLSGPVGQRLVCLDHGRIARARQGGEGDLAVGEGAELGELGLVPEACDHEPTPRRLAVPVLVGGMDRGRANLDQPAGRVGEEVQAIAPAQAGEQRGGGDRGEVGGGEWRALVPVDLAPRGVEHPDSVEPPAGHALLEVDGGPRGIVADHEGAHLVPLGVVGGEAFEGVAGEGDEARKLAGFVLGNLRAQHRRAALLGRMQERQRPHEDGGEGSEEQGEPGGEFHPKFRGRGNEGNKETSSHGKPVPTGPGIVPSPAR